MATGRAKRLRVRVAALAALVLVLVAALGLWPSRATLAHIAGQDTEFLPDAQRFPCESDGCGCQTPEHCWPSCCCHTRVQRLAWAIEHRVQPPATVTFTDDEWRAALAIQKHAEQENHPDPRTADSPRGWRWPFGTSSLACQKLGVLLTLAVVSWLLSVQLIFAPVVTGRLRLANDCERVSRTLDAIPPIPRRD